MLFSVKKRPMLTFFKPTTAQVQRFIQQEFDLPHSYLEVGHTRLDAAVQGYNNDFNFIELGSGEAVWEAAKAAVRQWRMFPGGWAYVAPADTPIEQGRAVATTPAPPSRLSTTQLWPVRREASRAKARPMMSTPPPAA